MKALVTLLGVASIAAIVVSPLVYIAGGISLDACKWAQIVATCGWFAAKFAPRGVPTPAAE